MLGISPGGVGFEAAPFKLTQEYIDILGGTDSAKFDEFKQLMRQGFKDVRKHAERIIMIVELMQKGRLAALLRYRAPRADDGQISYLQILSCPVSLWAISRHRICVIVSRSLYLLPRSTTLLIVSFWPAARVLIPDSTTASNSKSYSRLLSISI